VENGHEGRGDDKCGGDRPVDPDGQLKRSRKEFTFKADRISRILRRWRWGRGEVRLLRILAVRVLKKVKRAPQSGSRGGDSCGDRRKPAGSP